MTITEKNIYDIMILDNKNPYYQGISFVYNLTSPYLLKNTYHGKHLRIPIFI